MLSVAGIKDYATLVLGTELCDDASNLGPERVKGYEAWDHIGFVSPSEREWPSAEHST